MKTDTLLDKVNTILTPWAQETVRPEPNRLDVRLAPTNLLPAVKALHNQAWGYLAAITGLDLGLEAEKIEILYHFCQEAAVLTLRICLPRSETTIPTISHIIAPACLFERELSEMLGITVEHIPDPSRLFLPDDWPAGNYPLRKDFDLSGQPGAGKG